MDENKIMFFKLKSNENLICEAEFPIDGIRLIKNALLVRVTTDPASGKEFFVFAELPYCEEPIELEQQGSFIYKGKPTKELISDYLIVLEKKRVEKSGIIRPKLSIVTDPNNVA